MLCIIIVSPAVILVDGFEVKPGYFNYLQPEEIETISILKDAASLAQFGMHGDNGVIWIVTKNEFKNQKNRLLDCYLNYI